MWSVEVKRFYVETKEVNSKGNPVLVPITHRKLYVKSTPVTDSGEYRVVLKKNRYTISVIPRIKQSIWTNPSGKIEPWYKLAGDTMDEDGNLIRPYRRTDDKPMDSTEILRWLRFKIGAEAEAALLHLQTAEPMPMAA